MVFLIDFCVQTQGSASVSCAPNPIITNNGSNSPNFSYVSVLDSITGQYSIDAYRKDPATNNPLPGDPCNTLSRCQMVNCLNLDNTPRLNSGIRFCHAVDGSNSLNGWGYYNGVS